MDIKTLRENIHAQVENYLDNESLYDDDVQLRINPSTLQVDIVEQDDEMSDCDYIPVMELVCISTETPGEWAADDEAIDSLTSQYEAEE